MQRGDNEAEAGPREARYYPVERVHGRVLSGGAAVGAGRVPTVALQRNTRVQRGPPGALQRRLGGAARNGPGPDGELLEPDADVPADQVAVDRGDLVWTDTLPELTKYENKSLNHTHLQLKKRATNKLIN